MRNITLSMPFLSVLALDYLDKDGVVDNSKSER